MTLEEAIARAMSIEPTLDEYEMGAVEDITDALATFLSDRDAMLRVVDGELELVRATPVSLVTHSQDGEHWDEMHVPCEGKRLGRPLTHEERAVTLTPLEDR